MSIRMLPRSDQKDVDGRQRRDTEPADRIDEPRRTASWSFEDQHERRRIRNRLIVLAAAVPIVQLLRWLFR
jgi:hypothetical protein